MNTEISIKNSVKSCFKTSFSFSTRLYPHIYKIREFRAINLNKKFFIFLMKIQSFILLIVIKIIIYLPELRHFKPIK